MVVKLVMLFLYFAVLILIGIASSKRMKNVCDYFAAGKRLGFLPAALSTRATGESAWLLLGLTGMGAAVGYKAFWVVLGEVCGVAIAWLWMCRPFKRLTDAYQSITIPDYLESHFQDTTRQLRLVSAATLVVFVTIYVSAQIFATGKAFNSFLDWNFYLGAIVGFGVVLAYSVAGGFLAVVWSDVFQGSLMFLGLLLLPIVGLAVIGGWSVMEQRLEIIDPVLLTYSGAGGWSLTNLCSILSLAMIGVGFLGSPQIFVRFLSIRSENDIKFGTAIAIGWTILADCGAVVTGLVGRALFTSPGQKFETVLGENAEAVLPMMAETYLPLILVGLYVAIVLSAIMSTADSLLVVAGSAAVRDFYQKVRHPDLADTTLVGLSRGVTFVLALIALGIAVIVAWLTKEGREGTVFWFVIFGWGGIAATFCPTMILSLFWPKITKKGAIAAMITGFACIPIFKFWAPNWPVVGPYLVALSELPAAFLLSGLAGVIVSGFDRMAKS
jgi:sodium/proline symporter